MVHGNWALLFLNILEMLNFSMNRAIVVLNIVIKPFRCNILHCTDPTILPKEFLYIYDIRD